MDDGPSEKNWFDFSRGENRIVRKRNSITKKVSEHTVISNINVTGSQHQ